MYIILEAEILLLRYSIDSLFLIMSSEEEFEYKLCSALITPGRQWKQPVIELMTIENKNGSKNSPIVYWFNKSLLWFTCKNYRDPWKETDMCKKMKRKFRI
jgi:hypothetical protein